MGAHIVDGEFQSDKYPTCPAGKVPLSVKDKTAQDLLWEYAQRRRAVDAEFADDLEQALLGKGYVPPGKHPLSGPTRVLLSHLVELLTQGPPRSEPTWARSLLSILNAFDKRIADLEEPPR